MVEQARMEETIFKHAMFAESLLETSWTQRARRGCSTLTSFGLQAVMISLLLLIPLLRTVVLPAARTVSTPIRIGRPVPMPLTPRLRSGSAPATPSNPAIVRYLWSGAPHESNSAGGDDSAPQIGSGGDGAPEIELPGAPEFPLPITGTRPVMPATPAATLRTFRTSKMLEGSLYLRARPVYPPLARAARIQGEVVLSATISKAGAIENLRVLRGHPMLVKAAIDAVSQWRYRPYILNNDPVEVETEITVNFTLSGN